LASGIEDLSTASSKSLSFSPMTVTRAILPLPPLRSCLSDGVGGAADAIYIRVPAVKVV
jgi:hypothetical protein